MKPHESRVVAALATVSERAQTVQAVGCTIATKCRSCTTASLGGSTFGIPGEAGRDVLRYTAQARLKRAAALSRIRVQGEAPTRVYAEQGLN